MNQSNVVISSGSPTKNPIFGICNYVFNSLNHDAYQVRSDGRLYVASVAVQTNTPEPLSYDTEEGENNGVEPLKPHEIIQGMECEWSYTAVPKNNHVSSLYGNNNVLNAIPETYRRLTKETNTTNYKNNKNKNKNSKTPDSSACTTNTTNTTNNNTATNNNNATNSTNSTVDPDDSSAPIKSTTSFTLPVGGITLMQVVSRMSKNRLLVMLVGDKGYTRISEMRTIKNPHLAKHGSFSAMVNFHALELFVDQMNAGSNPSTKTR